MSIIKQPLLFAGSLVLLALTIEESGPGILVSAATFRKQHPRGGKVWQRYKQPLALSFGGTYLGLGLLSGHIAYLIVGAILGFGLWGTSYATAKLLA